MRSATRSTLAVVGMTAVIVLVLVWRQSPAALFIWAWEGTLATATLLTATLAGYVLLCGFRLGPLPALDQHRFRHVGDNRCGTRRTAQETEGDIARAACDVEKALAVARRQPVHHCVFPNSMNAH